MSTKSCAKKVLRGGTSVLFRRQYALAAYSSSGQSTYFAIPSFMSARIRHNNNLIAQHAIQAHEESSRWVTVEARLEIHGAIICLEYPTYSRVKIVPDAAYAWIQSE